MTGTDDSFGYLMSRVNNMLLYGKEGFNMKTFNNWRWLYHWTKAEEALSKEDEAKYKKHKEKMDRILLLKIRKG